MPSFMLVSQFEVFSQYMSIPKLANWFNIVHNMTRLDQFCNKCKYTPCYWDSACSVICPIIFIALAYYTVHSNVILNFTFLFVLLCNLHQFVKVIFSHDFVF